MRIVTWNVQTARPNPDGPRDIGAVVAALAPFHADVVAVQELDRGRKRSGRVDQPGMIAAGLRGRLLWSPTLRRGGEYGLAMVVNGSCEHLATIDLSGTREPRCLLVAAVEVEGARWTIAVTHLSRNTEFAQRQLVTALDELARHPPPRVLVGDLNLTPDEVLPWSTAAGYQLAAGPPTHSTRRRRVTRRIDHVLVDGAHIQSAVVHRLPVSDHCAIAAELSVGSRRR